MQLYASYPTKIQKRRCEAEIARLAREDTERVEILDHALDRMQQRDITTRQVFRTLIDAELLGVTWDSDNEKGWRCKLRYMTAGIAVVVVAKLIERDESTCLVVTTREG